jgi:hypothetical protein
VSGRHDNRRKVECCYRVAIRSREVVKSSTTGKPGPPAGPSGSGTVSTKKSGTKKAGDGEAGSATTNTSSDDGDDANLAVDPRVSLQRQSLKRASLVLAGLKPVTDADGNPIVGTPLAAPVANYTLKEPEIFKEGQNIEDWLKRLQQYFLGNGLTDPVRTSNILGNRLSADVHAAFNDVQLSDEIWSDPIRLGSVLPYTGSKGMAGMGTPAPLPRQVDWPV